MQGNQRLNMILHASTFLEFCLLRTGKEERVREYACTPSPTVGWQGQERADTFTLGQESTWPQRCSTPQCIGLDATQTKYPVWAEEEPWVNLRRNFYTVTPLWRCWRKSVRVYRLLSSLWHRYSLRLEGAARGWPNKWSWAIDPE